MMLPYIYISAYILTNGNMEYILNSHESFIFWSQVHCLTRSQLYELSLKHPVEIIFFRIDLAFRRTSKGYAVQFGSASRMLPICLFSSANYTYIILFWEMPQAIWTISFKNVFNPRIISQTINYSLTRRLISHTN